MTQGVSIIICCYNSAGRIANTLKYIALQKVAENLLWEVILVNNNSTDNTEEKVVEEWQKYTTARPQLKIIHEATPGLTFAKDKGISEAAYDIIVFCDDDNWLADNYIQEAYNIFTNNNSIGIAGGTSVAYCQVTPPGWFNKYSIHYAVGGKKEAGYTNAVFGAGMIIRKQVYTKLRAAHFQPQLSGRKGVKLSSGEDDELCFAAGLLGYKVYYSTTLQFTHYMPANRLTWQYFSMLYTSGFAWSGIVMELYHFVSDSRHNLHYNNSEAAYKYLKQKITVSLLNKIKTPLQLGRFIKAMFVIGEGNDYALKCKLAYNRYRLVTKNKKELLDIYNSIALFTKNAAPDKYNVKPTA